MVVSFLESRPLEPPIPEAVASNRFDRGERIPRVPVEILPSGIALRDSLLCRRGVLMLNLGVDRDGVFERDGVEIRGEAGRELDLPAELGGADLGADCLRLLFADVVDSAKRITATIASNTAIGFSPGFFIINPRMKAFFHKMQLSICPLSL